MRACTRCTTTCAYPHATPARPNAPHRTALPPHIFQVAEQARRSLLALSADNQVIVVSGESGAGKTFTSRAILDFLVHVHAVFLCQTGSCRPQKRFDACVVVTPCGAMAMFRTSFPPQSL